MLLSSICCLVNSVPWLLPQTLGQLSDPPRQPSSQLQQKMLLYIVELAWSALLSSNSKRRLTMIRQRSTQKVLVGIRHSRTTLGSIELCLGKEEALCNHRYNSLLTLGWWGRGMTQEIQDEWSSWNAFWSDLMEAIWSAILDRVETMWAWNMVIYIIHC